MLAENGWELSIEGDAKVRKTSMTPVEVHRGTEELYTRVDMSFKGNFLGWEKLKCCCRKVWIKAETRWTTGQVHGRLSPELKGLPIWIFALGQILSLDLSCVIWSSPPLLTLMFSRPEVRPRPFRRCSPGFQASLNHELLPCFLK